MLIDFRSLRRSPRRPSAHVSTGEQLEVRMLLSISPNLAPVLVNDNQAALVADPSSSADTPIATPLQDASTMEGVTVTPTAIITAADTVPRFVTQPTAISVRSGDWSDPTVWSSGKVPGAGDQVSIADGNVITYSAISNAHVDAIEISGSLIFSTSVSTRLTVGTMTVMPEGTLQIGTAASPVPNQVTAEIVIADQPLNLTLDPRQYGNGLLVYGKIDIHGAASNVTWSRLATELQAGDTNFLVSGAAPTWRPGDTLLFADSRQVLTTEADEFIGGQVPEQWEQVVVDYVQGNRVFLKSALQFDHLGARNSDGVLELLPHVAVLNRNVIIRSENPDGVRGHTFYAGRASVDIEYARFQDLGRTTAFADLDSTTVDASGVVTHIGTNQIGRYAVHFHHLMGLENPTNTGYQFKFIGNTVDGAKKWAVATHDSSFGLLEDNVVYDAEGAGFVTEDGSEFGNMFRDNITIRIQGTHEDGKEGNTATDYGRGGSGFWFRRSGNYVIGNVAADSTYAGFVIDGYFDLNPVVVPTARGVDKHEPGQGITMTNNRGGLFVNNEAYGMSRYGLWMAYPMGDDLTNSQNSLTIYNTRIWNVYHSGVVAYHSDHVLFDKLLILGDLNAQNRNDSGTNGMDLKQYENRNMIIRNSRIEGVRYGILAPRNDASQAGAEHPTIIENTILKAYINIVVSPAVGNRPSNGSSLTVNNVKFTMLTKLPVGPTPVASLLPPANIYMQYTTIDADLTQPSIVRVYNYNQVPGVNFQVFYREQANSFIMPQTDPALLTGRDDGMIGSPVAGLSNLGNWNTYGIAIAGGLLPVGASASRSEINGIVAPIQTPSTAAKVVLVTPWDGAPLNDNNPVRIRYNVIGALPKGATVYFSLDGGPPTTEYQDGGIYGLARGDHTLRVFIGDASGQEIAGTTGVTRTFFVNVPAAPVVPPPPPPPQPPAPPGDHVPFRFPTP